MGKRLDSALTNLVVAGTMAAAVMDKTIAVAQCMKIDAELKRLRAERRRWNKQLGVCLRRIEELANDGE